MSLLREDLSRSETVTYVCRCGSAYAAKAWRWVDAEARPELLDTVLRDGPVTGICAACGTPACTAPAWLVLWPGQQEARLMLDVSRRGSLVEELIQHLERAKADPVRVLPWLLQPGFEFIDRQEGIAPATRATKTTAEGEVRVSRDAKGRRTTGAPKPTTGHPSAPLRPLPDPAALFSAPFSEPTDSSARRASAISGRRPAEGAAPSVEAAGVPALRLDPKSLEAGIPMLIGPDPGLPPAAAMVRKDLGAFVAELSVDGGIVRISAKIDDALLEQWEGAKIDARPVHLRGWGYPLVGVRLVAKHFGQVGCVDAVVDPGDPIAGEVFRALAERFTVELHCEGQRKVVRTIVAEGLEPNAALCLESGRGLLARGEFPPEDFARAKAALATDGVKTRLKLPTETIADGAYLHIVGGADATRALDHLDRVSQKESLARLLEVDGLPMGEYDAIRRRVLEGALAHGLCAPRRFWRRLVASGLARDLAAYAVQLAENRAAHTGEEGDLDGDEAQRAWQQILELCQRKQLAVPPQVHEALGMVETGEWVEAGEWVEQDLPLVEEDAVWVEPVASSPPRRADPENRAGEIFVGSPAVAEQTSVHNAGDLAAPVRPPAQNTTDPSHDPLRDPAQRLRVATDILQGRAQGDVDLVLAALEAFDTDELLAIMADLSDLGPRAVPGLIAKLMSGRREVRQAAVILLGMSMEPAALDHLGDHLVREPTTVWLDVARALGGYGPAAIRVLCHILSREAATPLESRAIDRVSRALAEIALSDGDIAVSDDPTVASGNAAIEALADAADPRVSTAARRALASLKDVKTSGAQIRGEIPLAEVTEVRGFARRAYEAIMVPELEAEAEAEA